MEQNEIVDRSEDRKYFILTPQIVWALCDTPLEYTLWCVIKMIAGEEGQCFLDTDDLGTLAMMSHGSVCTYRQALMHKGLLIGQLKRDPQYPQPVWHLSIPNLWRRNLEWRETHNSLEDRLKAKRNRAESRQVLTAPREPSGADGGRSTVDGGRSTDDAKKNQKEDPKGERVSPVKPSAQDDGHLAKLFQRVQSDIELAYGSRNLWLADAQLVELGESKAVIAVRDEETRQACAGRLEAMVARNLLAALGFPANVRMDVEFTVLMEV